MFFFPEEAYAYGYKDGYVGNPPNQELVKYSEYWHGLSCGEIEFVEETFYKKE